MLRQRAAATDLEEALMGKIFTHMTMSLDGFIAGPDDQIGELFDWYETGDVSAPSRNEDISFHVDEASSQMLRELTENTGAPFDTQPDGCLT